MENTRTVRAVVTFGDEVLGEAEAFTTPTSAAWNNTEPVCARLSGMLGVPVAVLRLLDVRVPDGQRWAGVVRYHVEALERPAVRLAAAAGVDGIFEGHPLRSAWATAEGVRSALEWAGSRVELTGPPEQVKSWNLGGVFRLPTAGGTVWLKGLPPFGLAEAETLEWIDDPALTPVVLAKRPGWMIMSHLPGEDCWEAGPDLIERLVRRWAEAAQGLTAPGFLPDRRPGALPDLFAALLDGEAGRELDAAEAAGARRLQDALPGIVAGLAACGLPEGLAHGDFHAGNCRFDGTRATVLDFSDAHHGHPVIDGLRPEVFIDQERGAAARAAWAESWARAVPGSDPARALDLAPPLVHLSYAHRYQEFLDAIEPSERIYHEGDPADEIRAALKAFQVRWTSWPST